MLHIRGLRKRFEHPAPRLIFTGVDLDVAAGDFVVLMGESGSGKSTLLNLIAGLDRPDAGSVEYDGVEISRLPENARAAFRRRHLGFVFQAFHLLPYLSAADNVALPLVLLDAPAAERERRVRTMLAHVGLSDRAGARPGELSGGEMQRVAIARALVHEPKLVLADEPTGNLDAHSAAEILDLLHSRTRANQAACILVTHSAAAARSADRVYVLDAGGLHSATDNG